MQSQSIEGQEQIQFVSLHPSIVQRDRYQSQGDIQAPSTSQTGHIGQDQSAGRGRGQDLQAGDSDQAGQMTCFHCHQPGHTRRDCPRRQRSHGTEAEHVDQSDMQGTFYTCICCLMHHIHHCCILRDRVGLRG